MPGTGSAQRTLVKQGDQHALELLGVTPNADIRLTALTLDRATVAIGEAVTFTLTITVLDATPSTTVDSGDPRA